MASQFTQVLGYDGWVGQMQSGMSANAVDAAFLSSAEAFWHDGGTSAGWVRGLYQDLLDRGPDAAGNQYWLAQLQDGASKFAVALGFAASFEHEALVVAGDYQSLLGRSATAADIAYWAPRLAVSPSDAVLTASLIGSPEYYNSPTKGRGIAAAWVTSVYQDLFSRAPPAGESAWWESQLQAGD